MDNRSSKKPKRPRDMAQLAKAIVDEATGQAPQEPEATPEPEPTPEERHAAAVTLGRRGGKKGGPARAKKLTPEQRKEIARKAALARWAPEG
ncbi:MAG: histone H1 [Candidatus Liptonbacteria bacterium]|nr:histone H1 [Candidatus Liptonbacteria bacterium]